MDCDRGHDSFLTLSPINLSRRLSHEIQHHQYAAVVALQSTKTSRPKARPFSLTLSPVMRGKWEALSLRGKMLNRLSRLLLLHCCSENKLKTQTNTYIVALCGPVTSGVP
ncbi:hypothetical protein ACFX14_005607 [Malus domestica]